MYGLNRLAIIDKFLCHHVILKDIYTGFVSLERTRMFTHCTYQVHTASQQSCYENNHIHNAPLPIFQCIFHHSNTDSLYIPFCSPSLSLLKKKYTHHVLSSFFCLDLQHVECIDPLINVELLIEENHNYIQLNFAITECTWTKKKKFRFPMI